MTGTTRVPDVLAALYALAGTVPHVIAIDGEPTIGQPGDFIATGYTEQGPSVVNTEQITDYGLASPLETFDVMSEVVTQQGDTNLADCRARAAAALKVLSAGLLADPTLGGVAMLAQLTRTDWTQRQTTKGAMVVAQVTVSVQASKQ
jgi:hypothetical protein